MTNNEKVYKLAKDYGFDECAIISSEPFYRYKQDLDYNNYGEDFNINYDPSAYKSDGKYIVVLIKSYKPYKQEHFTKDHIYIDAYYVTGNASYFRAKEMSQDIVEMGHIAHFSPRIPYRHCALRAGFGRRGMNGLLVNKKYGSYMHIQCILTDMPLDITSDIKKVDTCNKCGKCVLACKGTALNGTGRVEMKNCIRHYMPAKRYVPEKMRNNVGSSFIGCTDCRTSCPYNVKIEAIEPHKDLLEACYIPILIDKGHELYKKHFNILQKYLGTNEVRPLKLLKSVVIVIGNIKDKKYLNMLKKLRRENNDEDLLEYIDWAIGEIKKGLNNI